MCQFIQREGFLVQLNSPLEYIVTSPTPVKPYASQEAVNETKKIALPDLGPLNCLSYFFENNVYREENSFALSDWKRDNVPHIHTCFEVHSGLAPQLFGDDHYFGRSLIMAFASGLAQARALYGDDISGVLPAPITVHFVNTDGKRFFFSVFQLNTMDANSDIKNVFWHDPTVHSLYDQCNYVTGRPVIEGCNPEVANKLLSIYLQS